MTVFTRPLLLASMLLASSIFSMTASESAPAQAKAPADQSCNSHGVKLRFICGIYNAEDLVQVPDSDWIIGSGLATDDRPGSGGLVVIDGHSHIAAKAAIDIDAKPQDPFLACPGPLKLVEFSAHGLNILPLAPGRSRLFVVGHGGREAIEIFDVIHRDGGAPQITWKGCILAPPDGAMNAVVGLVDGRIISTQFTSGQYTIEDVLQGTKTGAVYVWKPGSEFERLRGTELPGPNGVEVTPDGKYLFVAVTGTSSVLRYELADTQKAPVALLTRDFRTDNVRWGPNGRLLLAGPARAANCDLHALLTCIAGAPVVGALDPTSLKLTDVYRGPPEPFFQYLSAGLIVGNTLWLGSFMADRVGYVESKNLR